MPRFDFIKKTEIKTSFRVDKVRGAFDIDSTPVMAERWQGDIPCEKTDWNIGLIVGLSGSGKTSIGKNLYPSACFNGYSWNTKNSLLDDFDENLETNDIIKCLSSVGFASPPLWLLPFNSLSTGQKFRVEMARMILDESEIMIIDEFTSVIDRDVAKFGCAAINKAIKKYNKKRIFLSCHFDIVDWLCPDWVFDTGDNSFNVTRGALRRPDITLEIRSCSRTLWRIFEKYHYMSKKIANSARCFVALYNNKIVAFTSYLQFPHAHIKNFKRFHRTVVLPDYQGVGIGIAIQDEIAKYCKSKNYRIIIQTSNPSLCCGLLKSKKWKCTAKPNFRTPSKSKTIKHLVSSGSRKIMAFEYVGEK